MSWKHDKLSNSEVMKEFEKVAYDKGMIKDNSIAEAAKKIKKDVKSDNLISNLFGFANKLKQEGFEKYAMELEKKIMAYQVSKVAGEKDGEKLLEFAHPEGSPNVGDGELGNVENLIDQHKKMVEVARKSPMSKKNAKVLADVMVALGQNAELYKINAGEYVVSVKNHLTDILNGLNIKISKLFKTLGGVPRSEADQWIRRGKNKIFHQLNNIKSYIASGLKATNNITKENFNNIVGLVMANFQQISEWGIDKMLPYAESIDFNEKELGGKKQEFINTSVAMKQLSDGARLYIVNSIEFFGKLPYEHEETKQENIESIVKQEGPQQVQIEQPIETDRYKGQSWTIERVKTHIYNNITALDQFKKSDVFKTKNKQQKDSIDQAIKFLRSIDPKLISTEKIWEDKIDPYLKQIEVFVSQ